MARKPTTASVTASTEDLRVGCTGAIFAATKLTASNCAPGSQFTFGVQTVTDATSDGPLTRRRWGAAECSPVTPSTTSATTSGTPRPPLRPSCSDASPRSSASRERQVRAAVELLDGGVDRAVHRPVPQGGHRRRSTTPSCARSRSGCATCASWRSAGPPILESIRAQGKLDDALRGADPGRRLQGPARGHLPAVQAEAADQGADRPRGRARAARRRAARPTRRSTRSAAAAAFVDAEKGVADAAGRAGRRPGDPGRAVRRGRRPDRRAARAAVERGAGWSSTVREGKEEAGAKFADYFDFAEPFTKLPSHRILAHVPRREGGGPRRSPSSRARRAPRPAGRPTTSRASPRRFGVADRGPARPTAGCVDTVRWAWRTRILVHLGIDLRMRLRQAAEDEAVRVFAANLRDLLLAAPGRHPRHDGPRPGLPHRREGRRGRRAPARSSPPTRSTRTSRERSGTSRWRRWPGWPRRTTSS